MPCSGLHRNRRRVPRLCVGIELLTAALNGLHGGDACALSSGCVAPARSYCASSPMTGDYQRDSVVAAGVDCLPGIPTSVKTLLSTRRRLRPHRDPANYVSPNGMMRLMVEHRHGASRIAGAALPRCRCNRADHYLGTPTACRCHRPCSGSMSEPSVIRAELLTALTVGFQQMFAARTPRDIRFDASLVVMDEYIAEEQSFP